MAEQKHYPVQKVSFVYVLPDLQQLLVVFASMIHTSYASCTVECVHTPNVERQLIPGRSVVGGNADRGRPKCALLNYSQASWLATVRHRYCCYLESFL